MPEAACVVVAAVLKAFVEATSRNFETTLNRERWSQCGPVNLAEEEGRGGLVVQARPCSTISPLEAIKRLQRLSSGWLNPPGSAAGSGGVWLCVGWAVVEGSLRGVKN
jgi:hypothetical protein